LDISDTVKARASVSKTVTRASYEDIKGGVTIDGQTFKFRSAKAGGGNPGLLPIESENFDLSVEWYYGDADYLSVGYFHKTVENFIGNGFRQANLFGLTDPASGGLFEETAIANELDPNQGYIEVGGILGVTTAEPLYGDADNDPVMFTIRGPVNEKTAKADGLEINWQHNFGETGYGLIANATLVNSDVAYDPLQLVAQFALAGLSDSANLIGFYDKDGINVRVAYNWRDSFFNGIGQAAGSEEINPTQVKDYGQLDISASYEINDNLVIYMYGINVTEQDFRVYGREEAQVLQAGQTGARYNLGVRYTF
jgi:TonB-dependent receptor